MLSWSWGITLLGEKFGTTFWNRLIILHRDIKCVLLIIFLVQNFITSNNPISIRFISMNMNFNILARIGGGSSATTGKFCSFYPRLNLEAVFPALNQNCCMMNIALQPANIPCLKDSPHNLIKDLSKRTSKTSISQLFSKLLSKLFSKLFSKLRKIWKHSLTKYSKINTFNLPHKFEKLEKPS